MRQTVDQFNRMAGRLKLAFALLALFCSGALASVTISSWYYDRVISTIHGSYGGRIAAYNADIRRLQKEVDTERNVTRGQLEEQAQDIDKISDDLARLLSMLNETSRTAAQAATTAKSAAATAQGAAVNAAKTAIRVREFAIEPEQEVKPATANPFGERIEP